MKDQIKEIVRQAFEETYNDTPWNGGVWIYDYNCEGILQTSGIVNSESISTSGRRLVFVYLHDMKEGSKRFEQAVASAEKDVESQLKML